MNGGGVSVALCTYNGERYVADQVASIFRQTLLPVEIVVSDDSSTDGTLTVIESFRDAARERGVDLVVLPSAARVGVTANFERALGACRSDIIALSDQDDVWHPDRLATGIAAFADPRVLLVHADADLVAGDGRPWGASLYQALGVTPDLLRELAGPAALATLIRRNVITGATVMVRRHLLEAAVPFPATWLHDEWLAVIAASNQGLHPLVARLIDYRQHEGNQVGVQRPGLRQKIARVMEPRTDRYIRLERRAAALVGRLETLKVSETDMAVAVRKWDFERDRARYPRSRIARVPAVLRNLVSGRYASLSSQGRLDVIRDLVQASD